ncbi:helix-turn-helix domain-containing protein [Nocardia puris]|uniref:helix-turn-helix domain-containing protein n=1 Tax=Nocardia puris TaxID=208602 RepID=UPI002E1DBFF2
MIVEPSAVVTRADLHEALRRLHERHDASYQKVAAAAGVSIGAVHAAVNGTTFPTWETVRAILSVYGVPDRLLPTWRRAHERAAANNRPGRGRPAHKGSDRSDVDRADGPRLVDLVVRRGVDGELPRACELDPYLLFVTPSNYGRAGESGVGDPYVARDVDTELSRALSSDRLVLVVGPSKAGKTRSLFHAVQTHLPEARVVVPSRNSLTDIAACPQYRELPATVVLWLENLDEFLIGTHALTPGLLARLTARPHPTVVVATLRSEVRDRLRALAGGELTQDIRHLLDEAIEVRLNPTSDNPDEQARAAAAYPELTLDRFGLAEVLAGAPELLRRYHDARASDPLLWTVMRVVIDWARIGHPLPIPEAVLIDLARAAACDLEPHRDIHDNDITTAIASARTPIPGGGRVPALLAHPDPITIRGYRPFDYLVAADDDTRRGRVVPDEFWRTATSIIIEPDILHYVGLVASHRERKDWAETCWRRAAEAGDFAAMNNLGGFFHNRGEIGEAETWFLRGARAEDRISMENLAMFLKTLGRFDEAEDWFYRAAHVGARNIGYNAAVHMRERGEAAKAEVQFRQAAVMGHCNAMYELALLCEKRGDTDEAETWFQRAADAEHSMNALALPIGTPEQTDT